MSSSFTRLFNCLPTEDLTPFFTIKNNRKVPSQGYAFAQYPYCHHIILDQKSAEQGKKLVVCAYLHDGNPDECAIITYKPAVEQNKHGAEVYANGHHVGWIAADLSGYMYTNYSAYNVKMMAVIYDAILALDRKEAGERLKVFVYADEVRRTNRTQEEMLADLAIEQEEAKQAKERQAADAKKQKDALVIDDVDKELEDIFREFELQNTP